jgi:uncharacterized protein YjbJ (UPF0337 family)
VKRQVGEWTNDPNAEAEGAAQQLKGKAQKAWGNVKDAARNANENVNRETVIEHESKLEREREAAREDELKRTHTTHSR